MTLDHNKKKYPFMEYHFAGDAQTWRDPLVGSVIRALGKGWKVTILAQEEGLVFWQDLAQDWLPGRLEVVVTLAENANCNVLVLDSSLSHEQQRAWLESEQVVGKMHVISAGPLNHEFPYNLISQFTLEHQKLEGVRAFVGTGKGKTTSALGWAWQEARGKPVAVVQWFKEKSSGHLTWAINEHFAAKQLRHPEQLSFYPTGLGFYGSPALDRVKGEQAYQYHRERALEGVSLAGRLLREKEIGALVLDEFVDTLQAVSGNLPQDLLLLSEIQALLRDAVQSKIPVAVSGRRVTPEWSEFVATKIEIKNLRHPWTHEKRAAVSGLDF
jgi:ATP:corrinoid adenosyltransferase